MKIRLLQLWKIHTILAESKIPIQMSRVLNGNEVCRNDLPACFFKDSQSVKTGWPSTDGQKGLETDSTTPLCTSSSISLPSTNPRKSCFCAFANRLTCIISKTRWLNIRC